MLVVPFLAAMVLFTAAYFIYGRFLEKYYDIDDTKATPSHTDYDGIDRVPAHKAVLLGHHFSSIAGAGPVIGPIIAAITANARKAFAPAGIEVADVRINRTELPAGAAEAVYARMTTERERLAMVVACYLAAQACYVIILIILEVLSLEEEG